MSPIAHRPFAHLAHPREVVRQFTPAWFSAIMGTGVVALVLPHLAGGVLTPAARWLWLANSAMFVVFVALYAARWLFFAAEARRIVRHGAMSMALGTIPMALATVVNGLAAFGPAMFGPGVLALALPLWAIDAVLALVIGVGVPFAMFTRQEHHLDGMTAAWIMPVVAAEVVGTSGGLLIPHMADDGVRMLLLVSGYALWAFSVPIAFSILTILILRMALHRLPSGELAATSWLALGPFAMGALGLLVLGGEAPVVLDAHGLPDVGIVAHGLGVVGGLALWGIDVWWLAFALLVAVRTWRQGAPFNLGWWAYVFPLGVYVLATFRLGEALHAPAFAAIGVSLSVLLLAAWVVVAIRTLAGAWAGHLFAAPCIALGESGEAER